MAPWVGSQGGHACGCVARVRGARECARVQRALGVCCGACGGTLLFRAWEDLRVKCLKLHAANRRATTQLYRSAWRGSTRSHRKRSPTNTRTPHCLCCPTSTELPWVRVLPRILGLHCSAKSVSAPPLGSLLDLELRRAIKTPKLPGRWKTTGVKCRNNIPQTSPPSGHSATSKKCRKTAQIQSP